MNYQIILLFVVAIFNALFSLFTLRGDKNTTNTLFSLFALTLALWSLTIAFFINTKSLDSALIFANSYYIIAAAVPVLFLYFSLFFLNYKKPVKLHILYIIPFFIIIFLFIVNQNIIIEKVYWGSIDKEVVLNKMAYLFYIVYFVFYVSLSYYYLCKSYLSTKDLIKKIQLRFVIVGTIFAYILGMVFNLFLPLFGNYHYIWLGPLFTLVMVFSMGYAILKHHLFNMRVIVAELLTFSILIFVLIKILLAETVTAQIISVGLLVVIIIFGILLVRGVVKEIETRERVEKLAGEISMANDKLRILEKQKTEFVSIASHQLRTPLTAIKGYASMLIEGSFGKLSKNVLEAVENIFKSSQSLVVIIENFLMVSRIEQGRMQYQFNVIDLHGIVKEVVNSTKSNAQEKKLDIKINIEGLGSFKVYADHDKLKQVIYDVIDNAIKYTEKGFIKILISKNEESKKIRVAVSDTGIGISKDMKSELFKKFSKGKESKLGAGIGLYIAKEIVESHNGHIWAQSEGSGRGTTFFIELPEVKESVKM